eukprot:3292881-Amphidinium_carterae.2
MSSLGAFAAWPQKTHCSQAKFTLNLLGASVDGETLFEQHTPSLTVFEQGHLSRSTTCAEKSYDNLNTDASPRQYGDG